ncbi:peptidoglycan/LPS O-acetylase OafA/YrhL [Crossiella equi]|uniref:Peptidoglycan/LPS O-acetylase OafA/YrhL n=1 Tax=Crossiella equi TaxID=130796 RepID=A0ABS5A8W5_9PSEU|nr:acyltransferase family protein [Crossiella equi]MBP2472752.1 peptidoglycan/LPS O-acetylase OafA/YrhL [Crossiella equi]
MTDREYRPELQGLRALAVALVAGYHVFSDRVSGGVDVFFLLTGFFLTGGLLRAARRGTLDVVRQWGRTLARLLPAMVTVLAGTAVASYLVLPPERWFQTIRELLASAVFAENWRLVADSVDYFAHTDRASPVQHFWSLAVQGQFSLVWPLFLALVGIGAVRARRRAGLAIGAVFAASLAFSVHLTATEQTVAYFHSLTRVWEFALGGLLALVPWRLPGWTAWLGIAGLLACGLVLDVGMVFPGHAALWPLLAAALVVLGGRGNRLLAARPLAWLGDRSYALYLWHWPVLVLYLVARGGDRVGWRGGVLVLAASLVLAALTHRFVERPARRVRLAPFRFAVLLLAPVLALALAWQAIGVRQSRFDVAIGDLSYPGALARLPGSVFESAPPLPPLPPRIALPEDWASLDELACARSARDRELEMCSTSTVDSPAKTVVLVGDSHMQQYLAAVRPIAEQWNWRVVTMFKGLCPYSTASESMPGDLPCVRWNEAATAEILALRPDAVLTLASRDVRVGLTEHTPPGFVEQWRLLAAAGIRVVALRDNPRFDHWPSTCAYELGATTADCATDRAALYASPPPYELVGAPPNVTFVDLGDYLCEADRCPPVIGNLQVYLDDNHLSASFTASLAPVLSRHLLPALEH